MNAEILSVGTELLLGHVVNTDTAYVARALSSIGINVHYTATVGDNPQRLQRAVEESLSRCDLLVTTGGLGPTEDDLTKETVARAAGVPLAMNETCLQELLRYFAGRYCGENQKKQAVLPVGCTVLKNDCGSAPGCLFRSRQGALVVMLPGPPGELIPMLENYALPALAGQQEKAVILSRNLRVFGLGEGLTAEKLEDLLRGSNPTAATYALDNECFVRVTARAAQESEALAMMQPLMEKIRARLGNYLYTEEYASLEETVVQGLMRQKKTLATAESCTGGLLSQRLTAISGSSEIFEMGAVTYANRIKEQVLGVCSQTLREKGAVSYETACQMAQGIRQKAGSDLGIGITGIAGPGGGTPEKPVGRVYIALSDGEHTWVRCMPGGIGRTRSRAFYRQAASSHALDMVRRYLTGLPVLEDLEFPRAAGIPVSSPCPEKEKNS